MIREREVPREVPEAEAARKCGVHRGTMRSWRAEGLPHAIRGKSAFYDLAEVKAWLASQGRTGGRGRPRADGLPPGDGEAGAGGSAGGSAGAADLSSLDLDEIRKRRALAELRKSEALAERHELANAERRRELVKVGELREMLDVISSTIRRAGERLQRSHGVEAGRVLEDALDEVERAIGKGVKR